LLTNSFNRPARHPAVIDTSLHAPRRESSSGTSQNVRNNPERLVGRLE
jgi:hypothetical protein